MLSIIDLFYNQDKVYGSEEMIWRQSADRCGNQPINCSHTVLGLRQMDRQIILITRDVFIFTPRSTVNESTGSVLINIITFVKGKLCKIIRVIFMISFLNVIYGGFS